MTAVRAAVVAEVADVRRGVLVRRAAAEAVLRVGGVLQRGPREPRVVEAEHGAPAVDAGEVADLRVVAVHDERRVRQRRDRLAPALRDDLELAVAVELVAEEIAEQERARAEAPRHLRAAPPRPPRTARAPRRRRGSRVEATPETRFAPESLCATRTRPRRISATIARVVVLPFVAETSTEPLGRRRASRSIAPGSSFQRSFPGSVVPPPRPARRESEPAARKTAVSRASGIGGRTETGRYRPTPRSRELGPVSPFGGRHVACSAPRFRRSGVFPAASGTPGDVLRHALRREKESECLRGTNAGPARSGTALCGAPAVGAVTAPACSGARVAAALWLRRWWSPSRPPWRRRRRRASSPSRRRHPSSQPRRPPPPQTRPPQAASPTRPTARRGLRRACSTGPRTTRTIAST